MFVIQIPTVLDFLVWWLDCDFNNSSLDYYGTEYLIYPTFGSPLCNQITFILQKSILAVGSAVAGLADPWRADMVAVNGEVLGKIF